MTEDIYVHWHD